MARKLAVMPDVGVPPEPLREPILPEAIVPSLGMPSLLSAELQMPALEVDVGWAPSKKRKERTPEVVEEAEEQDLDGEIPDKIKKRKIRQQQLG